MNLLNLAKRTASGILIVLITIFSMWYHTPFFYIFLALIGTAMAWEWENMVSKQTTGLSVCIAGITSINILTLPNFPIISLINIVISTLVIYGYLKRKKLDNAFLLAFGNLYINFPLIALSFLMASFDTVGFFVILWLFVTVWASDTGGLVFGLTLKGPKLAPKISPKKSWSGFFGGIILAVGATYVYTMIIPELPSIVTGYFDGEEPKLVLYGFLGFTAITSIISQIGDLFESYIKRKLDIKDSSNLIPGHGGVFDRFDGMIFASVFVALSIIVWFISL